MIRTWSLEECVVRAVSTAAVAAQGLWDVVTRRPGCDYDLPLHTPESHQCANCGCVSPKCKPAKTWIGERFYCPECPPHPRDGADELTDIEAEIDTHEPADFYADEVMMLAGAFWCCTHKRVVRDCPDDCVERQKRIATTRSVANSALRGPDADIPVRNAALAMHNELDELCAYTDPDHSMVTEVCGVCRPVRDIVEQMIEERFPATFSAATVVGEGPEPCDQSAGPGVGRNSFPAAVTPPAAGDWTQQIVDVLSEHQPRDRGLGIHCRHRVTGLTHGTFDDWHEWRQHVAEEINQQLRFSK